MASQEQTGKKSIVLNVKKRRFDGGIEKDLIEYIESHQKGNAQTKAKTEFSVSDEAEATYEELAGPVRKTLDDDAATASTDTSDVSVPFDPPQEPTKPVNETRRQLFEAVCRGPIELVVGFAGLVTSMIATAVFGWLKQGPLQDEAQMLRKLSLKTMLVGARHCLYGPLTVPQVIFKS